MILLTKSFFFFLFIYYYYYYGYYTGHSFLIRNQTKALIPNDKESLQMEEDLDYFVNRISQGKNTCSDYLVDQISQGKNTCLRFKSLHKQDRSCLAWMILVDQISQGKNTWLRFKSLHKQDWSCNLNYVKLQRNWAIN